jgi:hypothetical protein
MILAYLGIELALPCRLWIKASEIQASLTKSICSKSCCMLRIDIFVFTTRLHLFFTVSGGVYFWHLVWLHAKEAEMYSIHAAEFVLLLMLK